MQIGGQTCKNVYEMCTYSDRASILHTTVAGWVRTELLYAHLVVQWISPHPPLICEESTGLYCLHKVEVHCTAPVNS